MDTNTVSTCKWLEYSTRNLEHYYNVVCPVPEFTMWQYSLWMTQHETNCYPIVSVLITFIVLLKPVIRRRLRESNVIDTETFCAQFNERNWFSYLYVTRIVARIDSLILVKFAALTSLNWCQTQLHSWTTIKMIAIQSLCTGQHMCITVWTIQL